MSKEQVVEEEKKTIDLMDAATAFRIVKDAINREEERLRKIANTEEQDPILLEGETSTGHYCQMMVDPKDVARILLKYDYPIYHLLMDDAPDEMWAELGRTYGLMTICGVDL